jgi:alkanesulfonate monooxygenase SsuD/methylene tetrahydromethanopterin reductase-like flavin-dependent oxidoreductase (luciferase family)
LLEETLGYLGALFDGEPASFDGERFRLRDAFNHPRPLQEPRPPLLVGGKGGTRLLSIAARYADGWNAVWRWTPENYAERAIAARRAVERAGRDPSTFRLSLGLFTIVGEDDADVRRRYELIGERLPDGVGEALSLDTLRDECLVGTPDQVVERMARFAEIGVSELIVCPAPVWFAMPDPSMVEFFADVVLQRLHEL